MKNMPLKTNEREIDGKSKWQNTKKEIQNKIILAQNNTQKVVKRWKYQLWINMLDNLKRQVDACLYMHRHTVKMNLRTDSVALLERYRSFFSLYWKLRLMLRVMVVVGGTYTSFASAPVPAPISIPMPTYLFNSRLVLIIVLFNIPYKIATHLYIVGFGSVVLPVVSR